MKKITEKSVYYTSQFTNCAKHDRKKTYSTSHQLTIPFHCKEKKVFIKKAINNKY